jgi:DNA mismatch endonuclease (patch repair protein)
LFALQADFSHFHPLSMDTLSKEARSRLMSRIKGRDTKPEKAVRSMLHRMGLRFRLCQRGLPGTPDIVLKKHKAVVFVHGCFWHQHPGCKQAHLPAGNAAYWQEKLARNVARDAKNIAALGEMGWRVLVVWECELRDPEALRLKLAGFFDLPSPPA